MKLILQILAISAFLPASAFASGIVGYWQHEKQPVWIEIEFEGDTATAVVRHNENKPEASGFEVMKDIVADGDTWRGQIYAEQLGEYKDMTIRLKGDDEMEVKVKVGFMSRTVKWRRASEIPTDQTQE